MMQAQDLVDWTPVFRLMSVGILIALGPLLWVWVRSRGQGLSRRLHLLTVLTLFLTFDLVLFGAFTRLTDSGLGCPDWPGCYGAASPIGAHGEISAAQASMPTGPVTFSKAWIEMVHRYLATGVGVLILTLAVASWAQWLRQRAQPAAHPVAAVHPWWPTLTLVWVCVQGAFGAWTVTMKLFPAIVTLHLLGAMLLLGLLCVQAVRYQQAAGRVAQTSVSGSTMVWMWVALGLVVVQIALGGWVSTNYAVLACEDFPLCQGSWWPVMDFQQGFELWRPLGKTGEGQYLPFAALTAIHFVHRAMAAVVMVALCALAWRLLRVPTLAMQGRCLLVLTAWQFLTGLSNVVLDWPLAAAVSHTGGAAGLVVVLTWAMAASRSVTWADQAQRAQLPAAMLQQRSGVKG
jgi:cytochrome c oxidase assembly protein subunit 15